MIHNDLNEWYTEYWVDNCVDYKCVKKGHSKMLMHFGLKKRFFFGWTLFSFYICSPFFGKGSSLLNIEIEMPM